jgi:hypothetical protein
MKRSFRQDTKGQVIVVTGLLVALLLLSTAIYVINVQKTVPKADSNGDSLFGGYKETVRNTLISALANASAGGSMDVLEADLSELKAAVLAHSYRAMLTMEYSTLNSAPYTGGLWIFGGDGGSGISSACASFTFASTSPSASSNVEYTLNVTSQLQVSGGYLQLNGTQKQVNLTVNIANEDKPALAQLLVFRYYKDALGWVQADLPSIVDYGNGTYAVSFDAETALQDDPLAVSVVCLDQRGISTGANLTCSRIT